MQNFRLIGGPGGHQLLIESLEKLSLGDEQGSSGRKTGDVRTKGRISSSTGRKFIFVRTKFMCVEPDEARRDPARLPSVR